MTDETNRDDVRLDRALGAWGRADPLGPTGDAAAIARILGHAEAVSRTPARQPRRWLPWLAGGGVAAAASVAVALLLAPPAPRPGAADGAAARMAAADPDAGASFALLYTPTIDEEMIL